MAGFIINGPLVPMNYESITVSNTAGGVALTAAEYKVGTVRNGQVHNDIAVAAFITVEAQDMRWTIDGTAPVATTTGHLIGDGESITIYGIDAITKFRAIREGGSDATIRVTYFKN